MQMTFRPHVTELRGWPHPTPRSFRAQLLASTAPSAVCAALPSLQRTT